MLSIRRLLIIAVAAVTVWAATYADVIKDLQAADATTKQLTSQVNSYTGTGSQILTIRNTIKTLKANIQQAITDTDASPVPTAAQGQQVLDYINNTLLPDTKTALTATKNKKATFKSSGVLAEVIQNLKDLKALVVTLADKLIAKAPTTALKNGGTTAKNQFVAAFDDAINFLSAA